MNNNLPGFDGAQLIGQPNPAQDIATGLWNAMGLTIGGPARVVTKDAVYLAEKCNLAAMMTASGCPKCGATIIGGGELVLIAVMMVVDDKPVTVPWHAIVSIGPRPLLEDKKP